MLLTFNREIFILYFIFLIFFQVFISCPEITITLQNVEDFKVFLLFLSKNLDKYEDYQFSVLAYRFLFKLIYEFLIRNFHQYKK